MSVFACLFVLALTRPVLAEAPTDAPALPVPTERVVTVATIEDLYTAVSGVESDSTILLQKGTYQLDKPLHVVGRKKNIAIRGATGKFEDVIIKGAGMNDRAVHHGFLIDATDGVLVADLSVGWVGFHPIMIQPACKNVHVYHCRLVDAGEQFIKASSSSTGSGCDGGTVEYSVMEYSTQGPPNGYTNGVDVHGGKDWIIRHNLFRNIRTPAGAQYKAVPAVLMWNGAKNTICEANTFINCDRAIAFGLIQRNGFLDHQGGLIRNNFIYVGKNEVRNVDAGIYVGSPDTKVLHNTIVLNGGYANAIETRFATTTNVEVHNNLADAAIVARDGAKFASAGNHTAARLTMFRDTKAGDLHLVANHGLKPVRPHAECANDWDGAKRAETETTAGASDPAAKNAAAAVDRPTAQ